MFESDAKAAGKTMEENRQTKRAQKEKGAAQKFARRTLTSLKPDYKLVSPQEWVSGWIVSSWVCVRSSWWLWLEFGNG
jgi:hypothetical protein